MAEHEKDYVPMLSGNIEMRRFTARSASMSVPPNASYDGEDSLVFHTGPLRTQRTTEYGVAVGPLSRNRKPENHWTGHGKLHNRSQAVMPEVLGGGAFPDTNYVTRNEHLLMSGPLGLCNNPDCTECPAVYKAKRSHQKSSVSLEKKLHNILYGDDDRWVKKWISGLNSYFPIMNPHTKVVQQWNKFFVISCLIAIFIDPLFFFLLSVQKNNKCIVFNWSLATAIAVVRSLTDFIYLLHIILQFRLAYVAPESRVVGAGDLVDQPKKNCSSLSSWILFIGFVCCVAASSGNDISSNTKLCGIIRSKLCQKSFTCNCPSSVYPKNYQISTTSWWAVSKWFHL